MKFLLVEEDKIKDNYLAGGDDQEVDSLGNPLTQEQINYFRNSKVRDNKGNLLVCYHGGNNSYDVIDPMHIKKSHDKGYLGVGYYLTASEKMARFYGDTVGAFYVNITNPITNKYIYSNRNDIAQYLINNCSKQELDDWKETCVYEFGYDDYEVDDELMYNELLDKLSDEYRYNMDTGFNSFAHTLTRYFQSKGFDGVMFTYGGRVEEVVIYSSNQIKSITNTNPTNSNNINEDISLQDKHAVREFADECKEDGLPLMDYKEFSELLNEQGMKPNEELYQVYVDAYNNEEDTDYIEVIRKEFEKMSSNEIIDLLGIPNNSNIDSDSPMFILPNGSIISVEQAGKLNNMVLSDNVHADMMYVIFTKIAEKYGVDYDEYVGTIDENEYVNILTYGKDWARVNCGETWMEERFYCVLPNHMTSAQYRSLEKWLEWGADTGKEEVLVYVGSDEVNQTYRFKETFPEDIIKRIKRYYSSGRLYECEMKENMNIPNDVEMFYDRHLKLWTIYLIDKEGNQISNTEYAPDRKEALYIANNKGLFTMRESLSTFNEGIDGWDNRTGVIKRIADYLYDNPEATPPKGYIPRRSREYEIAANIYGDYVTTPFGNISTDDLMQYARDNKLLSESNELEQRAKKHKKKSKGLGWYPGANFNSNAGDVEKGIEVFNNSTSLGSGTNVGEGTAMGEAINNTNTYFYYGPIYYRGNKISNKSSIYTSAHTINIAARNILFRAANGAADFYNYDIDDSKIKVIKSSEQPKPISKREICSHCGYELNDMGDCPICDYGEYDLLDEGLSSLEALWTLHRNLDD